MLSGSPIWAGMDFLRGSGAGSARIQAASIGIVMHGIWTFPGVALRHAARAAKRPYGIFVHGALDPWFHRHYPLKHLKKRLYWPVQYPVFRDALAVFFTAESERDLAKSSFRPNTWNSVVVGFRDQRSRGNPKRSIRTNRDVLPQISGASRTPLFAVPGPDPRRRRVATCSSKHLGKIAASFPDVDLVMAGPDQEGMQANLQRMAEQAGFGARVHWPGSIGGDLKWGALRACEAFILSSHSENFGIAVVEALAVGRPVLITNRVNIWKEIEKDKAGLVDDDTLEGTERLLRRWFEMLPAGREAMAARARSCFQSHFTMNQTALAIEQVFASAVSSIAENDGAGQVSDDAGVSIDPPGGAIAELSGSRKV